MGLQRLEVPDIFSSCLQRMPAGPDGIHRKGLATVRAPQRIKFEKGSGNVFADLGLADADKLYLRSQIGFRVFQLLESKNLTERETANLLKIRPAELAHLMNGHFSRFSESRIRGFLNHLDHKM